MGNQNRKLFFLVGLPRSGNTLFASIMNQNPEIAATANSVTLEIMKNLFLVKTTDTFQNFPDHKSLDNVLDNVFINYYQQWPQRIIIDRGPVMTKANFNVMQKHFKPGFKCIVLLRDLMEVFASYIKWYTENPNAFPNRYGCKNDEEKLLMLMNNDGAIVKDLKAIKNSYNYPNICHFIRYNDMITDPEKVFKELYKFLKEPYYPHYFENLKQVNINDIEYDDTVVGKNMHTIRPTIKKETNNYIVPKSIRERYGHIKI